jgi:hypothetical protein
MGKTGEKPLGMRVTLVLILLTCLINPFAPQSAEPPTLPTIDTVGRFHALSGEQIRAGYPVRIEGVVVYSDPKWKLLWLRDDTGMLFQQPPVSTELPQAKSKVVMTGRTALVEGRHKIADLKVVATGIGKLPPPRCSPAT